VFSLADPAAIGRLVRPGSVELTPMLDNVRARFPYLVGLVTTTVPSVAAKLPVPLLLDGSFAITIKLNSAIN
jgi:hypothetical protein